MRRTVAKITSVNFISLRARSFLIAEYALSMAIRAILFYRLSLAFLPVFSKILKNTWDKFIANVQDGVEARELTALLS